MTTIHRAPVPTAILLIGLLALAPLLCGLSARATAPGSDAHAGGGVPGNVPSVAGRVAGGAAVPPPIPTLEQRQRFIEAEQARYAASWEQAAEGPRAPASHPGGRPAHDEYDVIGYEIALDLDIPNMVLIGAVDLEARAEIPGLAEVELDLLDCMAVDHVTVNGTPASYTHAADILTVTLDGTYDPGETFAIGCSYHGTPDLPGGPQPFRWLNFYGTPMILSYSEPYGAPAWWLCKDDPKDKATFGIQVTCPDSLFVVSNGVLTQVIDQGNGRATYEWRTEYPMSTYLFSIAVTDYAHWSEVYTGLDGTTTMDVHYWTFPVDSADARVDWSRNVEMMEFYAGLFGEYPFLDEKYAIAEFMHPGAMEHQTATSMGWQWITGTHANDWVVAHELSHSWVGDMITMTTWEHAWCKEGFATYCEALWFEPLYGEDYYHNYMNNMNPLHYGQFQLYGIDPPLHAAIYYKGAWVLHMLRHVIGDDAFFAGIYGYANDPDFRYGVADTDDLCAAFEAASGEELSWFFEQWIYQPGYPTYRHHWWTAPAREGRDGYDVHLRLRQVQQTGPVFRMPIDILIETSSGEERFVVWDSLETQDFVLHVAGEPLGLQIDPDVWIIRSLEEMSDVTEEDPSARDGRDDDVIAEDPPLLRAFGVQPNPSIAGCRLRYELAAPAQVTVELFDATGRRVRRLQDALQPAGRCEIPWDGTDAAGRRVAGGLYGCRVTTPAGARLQRVLILR
ncbi:MAG: hypothetical protein GF330_11475 [Candidatus Eisenbacteria bacterium]|nr:hypothetical protein [Candidatus Eisenbacteria bacterium]